MLDALERIEISFKAQICDQMCFVTKNSEWYSDEENFATNRWSNSFERVSGKISEAIEGSKEPWIIHFNDRNDEGSLPPSWMICNILTFGQVSFVYSNLSNAYQKRIAKAYGVNGRVLRAWMRSLTSVRNICAHHNRLWNRSIDTPFFVPNILKKYNLDPSKLFFTLIATAILMEKISPRSRWAIEAKALLVEFSKVPRFEMGFPENWESVFDSALAEYKS